MPIMTVDYCPNCKSALDTFIAEGYFEGILACVKCHIAYIPKEFGEYTKKVKKKLRLACCGKSD